MKEQGAEPLGKAGKMLVGSTPLGLSLLETPGTWLFRVGYRLIPVSHFPIWAGQAGLKEVGPERPVHPGAAETWFTLHASLSLSSSPSVFLSSCPLPSPFLPQGHP